MIKPLFCPKVEKNREFSARIACVEAVSARTTYGIHSALFTNGSGLSPGAPRQALGAPRGPRPRLRRRVAERTGLYAIQGFVRPAARTNKTNSHHPANREQN